MPRPLIEKFRQSSYNLKRTEPEMTKLLPQSTCLVAEEQIFSL
jgi:hypothetical protein